MKETRVYEITGTAFQLDIFEKVLGRIEYLGSVGSSRRITIFVDGDGAVRFKCRKNGERLNHQDKKGYFETQTDGNVKVDLG